MHKAYIRGSKSMLAYTYCLYHRIQFMCDMDGWGFDRLYLHGIDNGWVYLSREIDDIENGRFTTAFYKRRLKYTGCLKYKKYNGEPVVLKGKFGYITLSGIDIELMLFGKLATFGNGL